MKLQVPKIPRTPGRWWRSWLLPPNHHHRGQEDSDSADSSPKLRRALGRSKGRRQESGGLQECQPSVQGWSARMGHVCRQEVRPLGLPRPRHQVQGVGDQAGGLQGHQDALRRLGSWPLSRHSVHSSTITTTTTAMSSVLLSSSLSATLQSCRKVWWLRHLPLLRKLNQEGHQGESLGRGQVEQGNDSVG